MGGFPTPLSQNGNFGTTIRHDSVGLDPGVLILALKLQYE
jgi:hypothetical protein